MATELHYKDGGTWRKAKELYYKDGGTWRKLKEAWYRDGGVWRKVFSGAAIVNPLPVVTLIQDFQLSPANASASIHVQPDGTIDIYANGQGNPLTTNWYAPTTAGIGASYWVRLTVTSGTGPSSGDSTGAWLSLAAFKSWTWAYTSNAAGARVGVFTLEIASDAGGVSVVASITGVTIRADVDI